jgi:hypothetical protein
LRQSSGIGLRNLDERYKLITTKNIHVEEASDHFLVQLPVLKMD